MAESKEERVAKSWQGFLKPVAEGLVALMAAGAIWLHAQSSESNELRYSAIDKRLTLVESQVSDLQNNQSALSGKIDKILEAVSDIRVDIAKMASNRR